MKNCPSCNQALAEEITSCPTCGSDVRQSRKQIDDYVIQEVLFEGHSSIVYRAIQQETHQSVTLRIFKAQSGVDEAVVKRLTKELDQLRSLPQDYFVRHIAIRQSSEGLWYRVSEWTDALHWGTLLSSGHLKNNRSLFVIFERIASILDGLHRIGHFMPHLTLEDIIAYSGDCDELCIKINYKLSRFLQAPVKSPGSTMLKKLFACHPDIIKQRPINLRSDIWSLGKVFVELLKGDLEIDNVRAEVDSLDLPPQALALLKAMLADDPNLRPRSMAEISQTLHGLIESVDDWQQETRASRQAFQNSRSSFQLFKRHPAILAMVVVVFFVLVGTGIYYIQKQSGVDAAFSRYANLYANSIGFVLSDYWLKDSQNFVYRNRTEGTAFLVDKEGHLLTNRHVACPWLEDSNLLMVAAQLRGQGEPVNFGYRVYLWFEGARAFKRLPQQAASLASEDHYFLSTAFRTGGKPGLTIAGVSRSPQKAWQLAKSPLKDDFAVLKIDSVPPGIKPLPLAKGMDVLKIPKLSPLIALGFPLGSRTQSKTVNVSVTRGHVRRTFEHSIQVDTSIHSGNSGGPMIDPKGQVVGIASSVAISWAQSPVPVATMLSDIGMVLPIAKAAVFLEELKTGQAKWDGLLDLSINEKLDRITTIADTKNWKKARTTADAELKLSSHPDLVMAAAMMRFCANNLDSARALFKKELSIVPDNDSARFMLYIIDKLSGQKNGPMHRQALLDADWRSSAEFFGHLVKVYEGQIPADIALKGAYSTSEQSWLNFVVGLKQTQKKNFKSAETLFKTAAGKAGANTWIYYLALATLDHVQNDRLAKLKTKRARRSYKQKTAAFFKRLKAGREKSAKPDSELAPLLTKLELPTISKTEKKNIEQTILARNKDNGAVLAQLVYHTAKTERWDQALRYARAFLKIGGRENGQRLRIGLIKAQILHKLGQTADAQIELKHFVGNVTDPWYRRLGESLLQEGPKAAFLNQANENSVNLVTAHTAHGFWTEAAGNKQEALSHYKEALSSYRDDMPEYQFAANRIEKLQE
jgi:S1-C subfamily serine protease